MPSIPSCSSGSSIAKSLVKAAEQPVNETRLRQRTEGAQVFRTVDSKTNAQTQREFDGFAAAGPSKLPTSDTRQVAVERLQQVQGHLAPPPKPVAKPKRLGLFEDWVAAVDGRPEALQRKYPPPPIGPHAPRK